jgi:DNA replication protein DnaC
MLNHPTLEKLHTLRFTGMLKALEEQRAQPEIDRLSFEERLGLLVDRELVERENRRLQTRLRKAKLRQQASIEDIDYRARRGLDRSVVLRLAECRWIGAHQNVLITGPTGVGKSYLACALAHKACLSGYGALYTRLPRLLRELQIAKGDGRYSKELTKLSKIDLLVLDDWGLVKLTTAEQQDLLEVLEDRHGVRSTIVTSQVPVEHWHDTMTCPTLADAILDRLIHAAYRLELSGESLRREQADLLESEQMP